MCMHIRSDLSGSDRIYCLRAHQFHHTANSSQAIQMNSIKLDDHISTSGFSVMYSIGVRLSPEELELLKYQFPPYFHTTQWKSMLDFFTTMANYHTRTTWKMLCDRLTAVNLTTQANAIREHCLAPTRSSVSRPSSGIGAIDNGIEWIRERSNLPDGPFIWTFLADSTIAHWVRARNPQLLPGNTSLRNLVERDGNFAPLVLNWLLRWEQHTERSSSFPTQHVNYGRAREQILAHVSIVKLALYNTFCSEKSLKLDELWRTQCSPLWKLRPRRSLTLSETRMSPVHGYLSARARQMRSCRSMPCRLTIRQSKPPL